MVRVLLQLYLCYSYARSRDRIHVLLLDSYCPNYRGLVESREAIKPRPSLLDLDVPISVHPAPDILTLRFC